MVFAEFQVWSTGWNGTDYSGPKKPVEALGSDGTYVLDGRKTQINQISDARKRAQSLIKMHGYRHIIGFKLFCGPKFTNARQVGNGDMIGL